MQTHALRQFIGKFLKIYRPFAGIFAVALVMVAVMSALALLPPYLQGKVVDSQKLGLFAKTALFIVLTGASLFAMGLVDVVRGIFQNKKLDFRLDRFSSRLALEKVFALSIGQHVNQNSGMVQSIATKGKHSMNTLVFTMLFEVLPTLITMIVISIALVVTAPRVGFIMVIGVMLFAVKLAHNNLKMHPLLKEIDDREHRFAKQESEVFQHASLVIASAQEARVIEECEEDLKGIQSFAEAIWNTYLKKWILLNGILALTWISASLLTAYSVQTGRYTIGFMVMIWWWFFQIQNNASRVGWMLRQVLRLYPPVAKYFELMDVETDVKVVANPVRPEKYAGKIEFRNVVMRYRTRPCVVDDEEDGERVIEPQTSSKDPALAGVSFTVNPGERVAIVGESGAGKTTLVQALLRAQDPEEGQILIDDNDLRILDPKHFREAIGLVEQQASLFDRSLRYNITFGMNGRGKLVTESELADIAKLACIDRFMENLTNGFDTIVGERGIRLSGGERQRVAIARALIKNPSILIFDEATSNLDAQNELAIREAIERASVGRTTIIVAHRFSTIRNVDKVVVFDKGKVVGIGTHEELERSCEFYQRLVRPQMAASEASAS
jgi:ABC-type multidrug transport system fused ATPase/permease subunit